MTNKAESEKAIRATAEECVWYLGILLEDWDWACEHTLVSCEVSKHLYELQELTSAVERPAELLVHEKAAAADAEFDANYEEWLCYLVNGALALAIEQSCNDQGLLLNADMRALRQQTVPDERRHSLGVFFRTCPRHVRALVVHDLFWMVRFERGRRTGSPVLRLSA